MTVGEKLWEGKGKSAGPGMIKDITIQSHNKMKLFPEMIVNIKALVV